MSGMMRLSLILALALALSSCAEYGYGYTTYPSGPCLSLVLLGCRVL